MKVIQISLLVACLIVNAIGKPTFDVIADIIHDIVHEPDVPPYGSHYTYNSAYPHSGHSGTGYTNGAYGYNQRPYQVNSANIYPHGAPNHYPNNPHVGSYPPGHYGSPAVYDNQGYYKGPPYANRPPNGYYYNNGQYGFNRK